MDSKTELASKVHYCSFMPYDTSDMVQPLFTSYISSAHMAGLHPFEYTGWRNECLSWHNNCYIHSHLNPSPVFKVSGPDALKFLKDTCVNTFEIFPVGKAKHAIMCNEDGLVAADGVLLRTGEEEFISFYLSPYQDYLFMNKKYNAKGENLTGRIFLFQLGGPNSLAIIEEACGENLHDIKFIHHRMSRIKGKAVRIVRLGMAGSLAYEVHGNMEDSILVYNVLMEAGKKRDLHKLGMPAYNMTHWENGFPQAFLDFIPPYYEDEGLAAFLAAAIPNLGEGASRLGGGKGNHGWSNAKFTGSMGPDAGLRYRNPVELGWAKTIKFDHDFVGRRALEKEVANPSRLMVTLEWSEEDILDIHRSQYGSGEPYADISLPDDVGYGNSVYHADKVLKDGREVGISTGRMFSSYYRTMISLCSIKPELSALGTEVTVLWGDPGTRQKEIRAKVARYPYMDEKRNEKVDVNKL